MAKDHSRTALILFFFLLLTAGCTSKKGITQDQSQAHKETVQLIPYRLSDKWGFCDTAKKVIIPAVYNDAAFFYGDFAAVSNDSGTCIIDKKGKRITPLLKNVQFTNEGKYYLRDSSYQKKIYKTSNNHLVTDKAYGIIWGFNAYGFAKVDLYSDQGFIDTNGREIVPCKYYIEVSPDHMAMLWGRSGDDKNEIGFFNLETGYTIPARYQEACLFSEGLAMVKNDSLWGFIDSLGKTVIPFEYDKMDSVNLGEYTVKYNSTYKNFFCEGFHESLALVKKGGKYGYINKKGETVIPFIFETAYGFKNGLAWIRKGKKWGMINKKGVEKIACIYDSPPFLWAKELTGLEGMSEGLVRVRKDTLEGFVDTLGRVAIPCKYESSGSFSNGLAAVLVGKKWGFINKGNQVVIPCMFEEVENINYYYDKDPFSRGFALALKEGKWIMIDNTGKQLGSFTSKNYPDSRTEFGLTSLKDDSKTYIFNKKGEILYTEENGGFLNIYGPYVIFNSNKKCYINVKTKKHYCD